MKRFIEALQFNRSKINFLIDELHRDFSPQIADPPCGGLGMIFNEFTMALEIVDFYYSIWSKKIIFTPDIFVMRERADNDGRLKRISINMLIANLSSVEFNIRSVAEKREDIFPISFNRLNQQKMVHLMSFVEEMRNNHLILPEEFKCWDFLNKMRNKLVHNNGIASEYCAFQFPNGASFQMEAGLQIKSKLIDVINVQTWIIDAYAEICRKILINRPS